MVLTRLEKTLMVLFLILTGTCIGLVTVYIIGNNRATAEVGCGSPQLFTGSQGEFNSTNYPGRYGNGESCSWHVTVDPDKVIHLWFEDFFVEDYVFCSADFFTVQDSLGIIGKFCGPSAPKPFVSLGNSLVLYFDTNERKTERGFRARYRAVSPEQTAEIVGAGGFLQGEYGEVTTPDFPDQNYENGALYQWRITVPAGERVRLTFISFDLVPEACEDHVSVYDGHTDGASLLGKFCGGKIPGAVVSSRNTLVMRFKTDFTHTAKGFHAVYSLASAPSPAEGNNGDEHNIL